MGGDQWWVVVPQDHAASPPWSLNSALQEMTVVARGDDWTEKMEKEVAFNGAKFVRTAIEACQQEAALPQEADALGGAIESHRAHRVKRKHERAMDQVRRARCFRKPDKLILAGTAVHIAPGGLDQHIGGADMLGPLSSRLNEFGVHAIAERPLDALGGIYIVIDPADADICVRITAILTGPSICNV